MDPKQQMEQFSLVWLHAVATLCGLSLHDPRVDDDSVDVTVGRTGGGGTLRSPRVDVQLKCCGRDLLGDDGIHYQLTKRKNFEDLADTRPMIPKILVVLLVPAAPSDWWRQVPETSLTLYRAAWWVSLRGMTSDAGQPTIVLPRGQLLDPPGLTALMDRIGNGELP